MSHSSLAARIVVPLVLASAAIASPAGGPEAAAAARAWLPAGVPAHPVVEGRIDGRAARVDAVRVPTDCPVLLAAVRAVWQGPPAAPVLEGRAGAWLTLTTLRDGHLAVMQARGSADGGCAALLTVWPTGVSSASEGLPGWPADLQVLRRLESGEAGHRELTVLATTPLSPVQAFARIDRFLAPTGLRLRPAAPSATHGPVSAGSAYAARRPGAQASLHLEPRGGSTDIVLIVQGVRP